MLELGYKQVQVWLDSRELKAIQKAFPGEPLAKLLRRLACEAAKAYGFDFEKESPGMMSDEQIAKTATLCQVIDGLRLPVRLVNNRADVPVVFGHMLDVFWNQAEGIFYADVATGFERWHGKDPECDYPSTDDIGKAMTDAFCTDIECLGASFSLRGVPRFELSRKPMFAGQ
jgi:hypothetical protein